MNLRWEWEQNTKNRGRKIKIRERTLSLLLQDPCRQQWVVRMPHWPADTSLWKVQPLAAVALQLALSYGTNWIFCLKRRYKTPPPGTMQCHSIASSVGLQTGFCGAAREGRWKGEVRRAQRGPRATLSGRVEGEGCPGGDSGRFSTFMLCPLLPEHCALPRILIISALHRMLPPAPLSFPVLYQNTLSNAPRLTAAAWKAQKGKSGF